MNGSSENAPKNVAMEFKPLQELSKQMNSLVEDHAREKHLLRNNVSSKNVHVRMNFSENVISILEVLLMIDKTFI